MGEVEILDTPFFRRESEDNTVLFLGHKVAVLVSGEDTKGKKRV